MNVTYTNVGYDILYICYLYKCQWLLFIIISQSLIKNGASKFDISKWMLLIQMPLMIFKNVTYKNLDYENVT